MKNIKTNRIDKEKLIECYKKNGNAVKTGLEFGVSSPTVLKIVRSHNVPVIGELKRYTDEFIISKYYELGTVEKTGKELGIGDERVIDVLDRNNVERKKLKHIEVGSVYHKLTVLEFVGYRVTSGGEKNRAFLCKCECGGTREVVSNKLTATKKPTKDCGCGFIKTQEEWELKRKETEINKQLRLERIEENKRKHELEKLNKKPPTERKYKVGYKHHRLSIISEVGTGDSMVFTVECECGTIKDIKRTTLPFTKSCGCLQREKSYRNGLFTNNDKEKELMYARYKNMKRRCYRKENDNYYLYGGRGIIVCDRWLESNGQGFVNFCMDMGERPGSEYSIDRINPDGNYEPSNCRWATASEQSKNQRRWKTN
jgi:hypothetical protein